MMNKRLVFFFIVSILVTIVTGSCEPLTVQAAPVVVISVKGEIDGEQVALVHRALAAAQQKQARAVVLEIDTFGGLVDSAVKIRDMISDAPFDTVCYIKNRAWSAGALIALSHKHIAIAPGGSIGAAEPIPTTEKTIAALKAEFASTANKTGRNPRVAEAMVDKSLGLPGYAEPGQILALTDYQAMQVGYAEVVAPDRAAVLEHYGLGSIADVEEYVPEWPDKFAGWVANPTVKSLLLSVIFLAVFAEIKTAGLGVAAFVGLVAAFLFFASQWMTGVAGWLELLLFVGGVLLIVVELMIPGFGFFGIAGASCILLSFFLTLGANLLAINIMAISLVIAIAVFLLLLKQLPSSRLWAKLVLKEAETTQEGFISGKNYSVYLGKEGQTITLLRPAGIVMIDGVHLDVVSEGQYIEPGTIVKVVSVSGSRILVKPVNKVDI
ncbi:MAG TPA: NfeD family protein [Negativicutes bacterium]|jgi:membrane-bound serine protease (ClpP class)